MPTYSYACTECDNRFDIVQSFSEDSLTVCNECNGKLRKLFNSVGIVFKGSGFYRTDNRGGGSTTASEPAAKSSDSSSSTKSESSAPASTPAPAAS
ncbi:FmdB family zinc ribbon protein [Rhodococcus gannanensis]|uniref:FmdB family zinc ribbon protein n=1 Tax=Rhodococcus gannanensis TaxID=1960308 RepID=A0ABW4P0I3_9NOCA